MIEKKIFCMDCGYKITARTNFFGKREGWNGVEFKEGVRCPDCAELFQQEQQAERMAKITKATKGKGKK